MDLITLLATGKEITDKDIQDELFNICDREHSSCSSDCPVYELNGREAPDTIENNRGCDTFKNGEKMLNFIREKSK